MDTPSNKPEEITLEQLIAHLDQLCKEDRFDEARSIVHKVVKQLPGTDTSARVAYRVGSWLSNSSRREEAAVLWELAADQKVDYWTPLALYNLATRHGTASTQRLRTLEKLALEWPRGVLTAIAADDLARDALKKGKVAHAQRWASRRLDILNATADRIDPQYDEDLDALHALAEHTWEVGGDASTATKLAQELVARAGARKQRLFVRRARTLLRAIDLQVTVYDLTRRTGKERNPTSRRTRAAFDTSRLSTMYMHGEHAAADALVDRVLREHPGTITAARAALLRAAERRRRKDYRGAAADLELAVEWGGDEVGPSAMAAQARMLRLKRRDTEATAVLVKLVSRWPGSRAAASAAWDLERLAEDETELQHWRECRRKILQDIAGDAGADEQEKMEALRDLVNHEWDYAPHHLRDPEAAVLHAQELLRRASRPKGDRRAAAWATRAIAAIEADVPTWELRNAVRSGATTGRDPSHRVH